MSEPARPFMSVREVAQYLDLNEKTVYKLVKDGTIPATKVTGKWVFPRELVDRWLLESSHGGVLADRLVVAGSDDPLLYRVTQQYAADVRSHALIAYTVTGTRLGLDLLEAGRVDACCLHWGPAAESRMRHPALLRQYSQHRRWVLVHLFRREQGLMLAPAHADDEPSPESLLRAPLRWAMRQEGSGSQRFLREIQARDEGAALAEPAPRAVALVARSEREAAAAIAMGEADVAPGARAAATEFGLAFVPFGWESFDVALRREVWFRRMFQEFLRRVGAAATRERAARLGGYDLADSGRLVFGET